MGSFSGAFVMWPGGVGRRGGGPGGGAPPALDHSVFEKNFPNLDAKINSKVRLIWIVCGTADSLIGVNRQFKSWLTSKGVQFTYDEVPDVGHVWPLWRQNLTTFAQKVFQPKGARAAMNRHPTTRTTTRRWPTRIRICRTSSR